MDSTEPRREDAQEPSDEALVRAVARGDHGALGALHKRYAAWVYRAARRALDAAAAEEIVQDVFVQVWRRGETFDPARGTFRGWLAQIARARVLNELRRRGRRPALAPDADAAEAAPDDAEAVPDEAAWRDYRATVLRAAVEALPPTQRRALSLAFLDELPHAQVAASLGVPLGTAKTRIRAGLRQLHVALAPLLLLALLFVVLLARRTVNDERFARARDERALGTVTASDLATLRLVPPGEPEHPAPGVDPLRQRHATYRARPGEPLAVVTFSNLAPPADGSTYAAWARHGARWTRLGAARPDARGHALFIAEDPALAARPDGLELTLEPDATQTASPRGPVVLAWPARD